jgi:hypothetical protein
MNIRFPLVLSSLRPLVLGRLPPFVLSLSKDRGHARPFRLAQRHKATKKNLCLLSFFPSCLRAQKPSVSRFHERAA